MRRDHRAAEHGLLGKDGKRDEQSYKDLLTEMGILASIPTNPHIVHFLGACITDIEHPVVFEELIKGPSLENFLLKRANTASRLERRTIFGWSLQILRALDFLHCCEPIIMHRGSTYKDLMLTRLRTHTIHPVVHESAEAQAN